MTNLIESGPPSASNIIKHMVSEKRPVMMSEIKRDLDVDWNTIKRNFNWLEQIGRVHQKFIGTKKYYELNGKGKHQTSFDIDETTRLWIDIFEPRGDYKQHFVRIKQSRRISPNEWETVSTINIKRDKLKDFIDELSKIDSTLNEFY